METSAIKPYLKSTFHLLHYTFVILPIVAGADKFVNLLTDWGQYLNPVIGNNLPFSISTFMGIIGVIEIIAGIITLIKPRIGGYIVTIWLSLIALSLLSGWMYVDLAVRDIVMAIAASVLVKLSKIYA